MKRDINRWWTVFGGAVCLSVGAGVLSAFMFGMFIKPIAAENHWSRAQVSLGLTVFEFSMGPGTILLGSLIDKMGVRRPTLLFLILFAASTALVGVLPASPWVFALAFLAVGLFAPSTNALPYAKVICARFDRQRGLALGLMVGGTAVGAMFMPHYAGYLLMHFGWRAGYFGVAASMVVFSVPALYFLVKMPPGVDEELVRKTREARSELPSLWALFLNDRTFRLLGLSIFCVSGVLLALLSQFVPMMTDRGESVTAAATMLSIAGSTSAVGRLFAGWLMDRLHAPYCAAMSFALTLIGVLILASGATSYTAMIAAGLVGISIGAEADIITFIVSRYFDLRLFGRVSGAMWMAWGWGAGIMIFASGLSFDLTHSYRIALWTFSGFVSIAVVSIMRLGPYVYPEQRDPKRAALVAGASA